MEAICDFFYKVFMVMIFSGGGSLAGCCVTEYESSGPNGWGGYEWCEEVNEPRKPYDCPEPDPIDGAYAKVCEDFSAPIHSRCPGEGHLMATGFSDEEDEYEFQMMIDDLRQSIKENG